MNVRDLTNVDIAVLAQEFQMLVGTRLEKIYRHEKNEFRLRFRTKEGQKDLVILLPQSIHFTEYAKKAGEPTGMTMELRKYLNGKILQSLEQINFDRILVLNFKEHKLIIEMFGKGNLILADKDDKVITLTRMEEGKLRTIKRGFTYSALEMKKIHPEDISKNKLFEKIKPEDKDLKVIVFLSRNVNLPAMYLNEILYHADVDSKKKTSEVTEDEIKSINKSIKLFLIQMKEPNPAITREKYESVRLTPDVDAVKFKSFSELLDEIYSTHEKVPETNEKMDKIKRKQGHQEEHREKLIIQAEEQKKLGDFVMEHATEIEIIISEIKLLKSQGMKSEEIEKKFKEKIKFGKGTVEIDL